MQGAQSRGGETRVEREDFLLSIYYENGHDSPWETIIKDEKVITFSL